MAPPGRRSRLGGGIGRPASSAAARMIGRRPDEIVSTDFHTLVHPTFPGVLTCDVSRCRLYAVVHGAFNHDEVESTFFRTDGTSFPVAYTATPMIDDHGEIVPGRGTTRSRAVSWN